MTTLSSMFRTGLIGVDYVKVSDTKAYNAHGGTFTQDAWRTRDINTEDSDASGICSIDSNQITLEAGTYICKIRATGYCVSTHKAILYNISDSEITLTGDVQNSKYDAAAYSSSASAISGGFTISSQTIFEVQHYCVLTYASYGFGIAQGVAGSDSVYMTAEFFRIKDLSKAMSEIANYVKVSDVKAYNVAGGTFTKDAWRTRDINTEDSDVSGICTIDSNQITLEAGTYICDIDAPGYYVNNHISRLYNISDSAVELSGTPEMSYAPDGYCSNKSTIKGKFTIASQKTFEVQHYSKSTYTTSGFGITATVADTPSIYTVAEFWRVAT